MKNINWSGAMRSLALVAAAACAVPSAVASDRLDGLFSKIEPSLRERAFMRLNYVHANVKTTSGDAYDVTGPVIRPGDITALASSGYVSMFYAAGLNGQPTTARVNTGSFYTVAGGLLDNFMTSPAPFPGVEGDVVSCPQLSQGLGTPCGIKARSQASVGTPAISVGYFIDQSMNWALEAFLIAAPLKASVYGEGRNSLNGQRIIDLKLLPPTAVLGRYFGDKNDRIRPFVGFGASYAIFFDVRATDALNTYQGGGNAGDTSVSIKNALGFGPFFGVQGRLDDDWHVSLNVGKLSYSTEATLITRNTKITAESQVINDYGPGITTANTLGINGGGGRPVQVAPAGDGAPLVDGYQPGDAIAPLTALMCDVARSKYGNNECNHGTFVRKQKTKLDNTLFMLSIGRRF